MTTRRTLASALLVVLSASACGGGATEVAAPSVDPSLAPRGDTSANLRVDRVVDGDTVRVWIDGESVSVRMIGIDTPETVKQDAPVECFGPEASDFAKDLLSGATVTLEFDDSQGRTDAYDRALAYVWRELPDGTLRLFNLEAIVGGYAEERQYGSSRFAWQPEFAAAESAARAGLVGRWGACPAT